MPNVLLENLKKMKGRPSIHSAGRATKDGYIRKSSSPPQNYRSSASGSLSSSHSDDSNTMPKKNISTNATDSQVLTPARDPRPTPAPRNRGKPPKSTKLQDSTDGEFEEGVEATEDNQSLVSSSDKNQQSITAESLHGPPPPPPPTIPQPDPNQKFPPSDPSPQIPPSDPSQQIPPQPNPRKQFPPQRNATNTNTQALTGTELVSVTNTLADDTNPELETVTNPELETVTNSELKNSTKVAMTSTKEVAEVKVKKTAKTMLTSFSKEIKSYVNKNVVKLGEKDKSKDEYDFNSTRNLDDLLPHLHTPDIKTTETKTYFTERLQENYDSNIYPNIQSLLAHSSDEEEEKDKPRHVNTKENTKFKNTYFIYVLVFLSVIVGIVALLTPSIVKEYHEHFSLTNSIKKMQATFPTQDRDTWLYLQVGLESVKNFSRPTVFMLVHHDKQGIAVDLAKKMGQAAAIYLNDGDEAAQPTMIFDNELHLKDHGELITNYKEKLQQNHVMIIDGIEKVPGKVAQGFRYFCDEYSPMVKEAAVFFTINLNSCPTVVQEEEFLKANVRDMTVMIEDCLREAWKTELNINVIQPVLVRIVGSVLKIVPEESNEV